MNKWTIVGTLSTALLASNALAGESVTYEVNGQMYEGYWSQSSADAPLVVLIHDWDGLTEYEQQRSAMLTEMGYNVFAVDLFGKGIRPTEVKDKRQHTGELYKDRQKMRDLINGGMVKAQSLGGNLDNNVLMGYCFGGAAVLEAARAGIQSNGYATFHGGLSTPEGQNYAKTKSPVLVLHGTADTAIPMTQFAQLAVELENQGISHEMITYSGAPHAFTVFESGNYRADADKASWDRFGAFLASHTQ